jgi:hypothetical protein
VGAGTFVLPSGSEDENLILSVLGQPLGEKYKRQWIEFDCQNGVHHGKWATWENGARVRVPKGHIGRFNEVEKLGEYGKSRVRKFINETHTCRYPERFQKDLIECGIIGIEVNGWPSGSRDGGLADGKGKDVTVRSNIHPA